MKGPLYLGIDFGTSYIKCTVLDVDGEIVFQYRTSSKILNPKPGFYEVDPVETWWKGFLNICKKLEEQELISRIKYVGVSSICGSFVPVNENFEPTYNAILYGIDKRAQKQIESLNKDYPSDYLKRSIGGIFDTHSLIPKMLWFKENEPILYKKTRWFLESTNFITSRLTGNVAWDYPTASGSKLIDFGKKDYTKILQDLGLLEKLPPLKWPSELLGTVEKWSSKIVGLPENTFIAVGSCDINAEMIAGGVELPGDMLIVLGSTISLILVVSEYSYTDNFIISFGVKNGTYKIGGATASGGRFLNWVKRIFGISEEKKIGEDISGIVILPYIDGARLPFNNPEAKVTIWGLDSQITHSKILRASKEALGYEMALIMDLLREKYRIPGFIMVKGGLANDHELVQIMADILGIDLKIVPDELDASYGAAVIAKMLENPSLNLRGMHKYDKYKLVRSNQENHKIYRKYLNIYKSLCNHLILTKIN